MQELIPILVAQALAYSLPEIVAVVLAISYLALAIQQNIWCWLCAGLSTAIFASLFFNVQLYMEAVLNLFYFMMAIYGWWQWNTGRDESHEMPVVIWSRKTHILAVVAILTMSVVSGFILDTRTDAAFPYVDSMTSWAAVWATFLTARKVLENWWYWLLIDATMIYIFCAKDLQFTALLYAIYVLMIPFGLVSWTRSWRESQA